MKTDGLIERIIYALLVAVSLAALWLVMNAPPAFLDARLVYQGF
jgi:hypothetical protein